MNYYGEFLSLNDIPYRVDIKCDTGSATTKIQMSGDPFITAMDTDSDLLYSHVKGSGATVRIVLSEAKFDIYSENPTGTKVTLTNQNTNKIVWAGYCTPCSYDMPYAQEFETCELECVDGISVLKNIKYGDTAVRDLKTFSQIIFQCLNKAKIFKNLYISNNIQMTSPTANDSVIEKLKISDQTFYEERDNADQTDLDLSLTCYEVLFEIMQFLGYTILAQGEDVYILDYDAIRQKQNSYFRYDFGESDFINRTSVTLSNSFNIAGTDVSADGTNLSLTPVYNKVVVKDEFYSISEESSDIGKSENMTNITGVGDRLYALNNAKGGHDAEWFQVEYIEGKSKDDKNTNVNVFYSRDWRGRRWCGAIRFYTHPAFKMYSWAKTEKSDTARTNISNGYNNRELLLNDFYYGHGAHLIRMYKRKIEKDEYNKVAATWPSGTTRNMSNDKKKDEWAKLLMADPQKIGMESLIVMINHRQMHIGPGAASKIFNESDNHLDHGNQNREDEDCRNYQFFEYTTDAPVAFGGSDDAYIVIGGQILSHEDEYTPFPLTGAAEDGSKLRREGDFKWNSQFFNWCRLEFGGRYWNGITWQSSPCDFKLYFHKQDNGKTKVYDYYDRWYDICSPNGETGWDQTEKGYYIPVDDVLTGKLKLTVYCQRDWWGRSKNDKWDGDSYTYWNGSKSRKLKDGKYSRYWNHVQCWKGFKVSFIMSNGLLDDEGNNTDTLYSNKLENDAVEQMPEITFKINTFDDKNQAHSIVYYTQGTEDKYLNYIYNKALYPQMQQEFGSVSGDDNLRAEEMLIYRLVRQYEKPRVIYDYTLAGLDYRPYTLFTDNVIKNKSFIAHTLSYDYFNDMTSIKLIEKI